MSAPGSSKAAGEDADSSVNLAGNYAFGVDPMQQLMEGQTAANPIIIDSSEDNSGQATSQPHYPSLLEPAMDITPNTGPVPVALSVPGIQRPIRRPTIQDQVHAQEVIDTLKLAYDKHVSASPSKFVSEQNSAEYKLVFDELMKHIPNLDKALVHQHAIFNDKQLSQRLVQIVMASQKQLTLLSSPNPQYIFDINTVKKLGEIARGSYALFVRAVNGLREAELKAAEGAKNSEAVSESN